MVGAAGDDEAGVARVRDEDGVGGIGRVVLRAVLVELLDEGLKAGEFLGGGEFEDAGLAGGTGGLGGLEVVDDLFDGGELLLGSGEDELVGFGVLEDEDFVGAEVGLGLDAVGEDLADLGGEGGGAALGEGDDLHAAVGGSAEGLIELLDDEGDALEFLGIAGDDEGAGLGVDGDGGALLGAAIGVVADEGGGEDLGDLGGFGGLDLEDAGGGRLVGDLVELADDILDGGELVGFADEDEAVGAGVGGDEGIGGSGAEAGLGLFEVKGADGGSEFDGGGGGEVEDAGLAVGGGSGLGGADLLEDGLDLFQVIGLAGDDEAAGAGIGEDLGVGGVGLGAFLPLILVELLDEGSEALGIGDGADVDGAGFAGGGGGADVALEAFDDGDDVGHLVRAGGDDDATGAGVGDELGVGGTEFGVAVELVAVELLGEGEDAVGLGHAAEVEDAGFACWASWGGEGFYDLLDGGGLFGGALDEESSAGGIRVEGGGLEGLAGGLFGVDRLDAGEDLGGGDVLEVDGVEFAVALFGLGVEGGDDLLDLGHEVGRGGGDDALGGGLRGEGDRVDGGAGVLGGEDLVGEGGDGVGVALDVEDAEDAFAGAGGGGGATGIVVEFLDDGFGVLEVGAGAGDDERVGFVVGGDGDAADGVAAGVVAHHRGGDDGRHHGGVGLVELEDAGAGGLLGCVVESGEEGSDLFDFLAWAGDEDAVAGGVGGDLGGGDELGAVLVAEEFGEEVVEGGGDGGGVGRLEVEDAELAGSGVVAGIELLDDLAGLFDGGLVPGDDEGVGAGVEDDADELALGVDGFLDEGGEFGGGGGSEPEDAGFLLGSLAVVGVELADDGFDAGDFLVGAGDHEAVELGFGEDGGRAAGGFGEALDLFCVELLDDRGDLGGLTGPEFDGLEGAGGGGGGRGVELADEGPDPFDVIGAGEGEDLLAGGIGDEGRGLGVWGAELTEELIDERDDLGSGLGGEGDDRQVAAVGVGGGVDDGDDLFDLAELVLGGGDEEAVVGGVGDEGGFGD